jgi:hypothetical protein
MELCRLAEDNDELYKPTGPIKIFARIILSDDHFGVTLQNNCDRDLFLSVFHFDPAQFSIQRWYVPPSRNVAAPLRQGSALTIGYGNNDSMALTFDLRPHSKSESSFLVLFLSTEYADPKHLEHSGVFDQCAGLGPPMLGDGLHVPKRGVRSPLRLGRGGFKVQPIGQRGFWDIIRASITAGRTSDDVQMPYALKPTKRGASASMIHPKAWFSWGSRR